jgi:hypothetical protein
MTVGVIPDRALSRLKTALLVAGGLLALASAIPRVQNLDAPLLDQYAFRQTQTAITVKSFLAHGIDMVDYETPVFGPPWQVPFELPVFQATAALLARLHAVNGSIDGACRLAGVVYFYLSAVLLYATCTLYLTRGTSFLVVIVYLWTPFNLIWSRACMIDYASVAFALAYLFATIRWLRRPRHSTWLAVGVICGSLAGTVKITTLPVVAVPLAFLVLTHVAALRRGAQRGSTVQALLTAHWRELGGVVALAAIPIAVSALWIHHTDKVKAISIFTQWLTSDALRDWNFGTWRQRLEIANWVAIARRVRHLMMPSGLVLMPIAALLGSRRLGWEARVFLVSVATAIPITVSIFFNLYVVHEYYLIAVAPGIAVLVGCGLATVMSEGGRTGLLARSALAAILLVGAARAINALDLITSQSPRPEYRELAVARMIAQVTGPDDVVVLGEAQQQWDSSIPYYADRRVCILRDDGSDPRVKEFLVQGGYRYAALHLNHPARLRDWDKRLLAEGEEYRVYEISYRGTPAAPQHAEGAPDTEPQTCFAFSPGDDTVEFTPLHDVVITPTPEGLVLLATGDDPYVLLPGFDVPPNRSLVVNLDITSPSHTELKVYFTTASSPQFSEELRAASELLEGRNHASVHIVHPAVVGRLRLDPGSSPGTYVLHSVQVVAEPN